MLLVDIKLPCDMCYQITVLHVTISLLVYHCKHNIAWRIYRNALLAYHFVGSSADGAISMDFNQSLAQNKYPPDLPQSITIQQCGISNVPDVQ